LFLPPRSLIPVTKHRGKSHGPAERKLDREDIVEIVYGKLGVVRNKTEELVMASLRNS
jgi:hypothetical protein